MDENTTGTVGTEGTTTPSGGENTTGTTTPTPEVKTFTQDDLNRVGAKEKKQGEAAILKELGLTSKEELAGLKEILSAHATEKASKMTASDVQKAFDEFKAKTDSEKATALAEVMQAKQEAWVAKKGIPDDLAEFYLFKISRMMTADDLDFETAATKYLKEHPVEVKQDGKAPMWGGGSTKPNGKPNTSTTMGALDALEGKYK